MPAPTQQRLVSVGRRRGPNRIAIFALVLVLFAGAGLLVWRAVPRVGDLLRADGCVATTPEGSIDLDFEQASSAATIAEIGLDQGVGVGGVAIGLATALQESKLRNLEGGDRDSVGLFQQRPSQGWGTVAQISDPVYASTKFYEALKKVRNYKTIPLTEAAQAVQRSAYGELYAEHELDAERLARVFTGRVPKGLSCSLRPVTVSAETEGSTGLTPRAVTVRRGFERVFGKQSLGGFAPGGVSTGHISGSAHYDGRAIDIFYRPVTTANKRQGWTMAHWLVAHAQEYAIATVIYDDAVWTAERSDEGWRVYVPAGASEDQANLTSAPSAQDVVRRHLDHVHVDVLRG